MDLLLNDVATESGDREEEANTGVLQTYTETIVNEYLLEVAVMLGELFDNSQSIKKLKVG